ncbi:hypothetical protein BSY48_004413 [Salmonella enterica subsp. enterica serovar Agbeni]|nr:hypothetical protein [Salmonella enterica subsp. enterica serovar Agbeni]
MKVITYLAANLIRAVILTLVGIMGILGFIMLCPFPAFWRELLEKGEGYAEDKA